MKKIAFIIGLILISSLLFAQTISISPNEQDVNAGAPFNTNIEISNVTNLGGFEIEIQFNPDYITVNEIQIGNFLGSTGRTVFPLENEIDNVNGIITYAVTTLGSNPPGPDGSGVLLEIDWFSNPSITSNVSTEISIESIQVTEIDGTLIDVSFSNGTINLIAGSTTTVNNNISFVSGCPGEIELPISVSNFENINEFELVINYPNNLDYSGYDNVNSLVSGMTITGGGGEITMNYSGGVASIGSGVLVDLIFIAGSEDGGQDYIIEWVEDNCNYSGPNGTVNGNYYDGEISVDVLPDDASSIIGESEVCESSTNILYQTGNIANANEYIWSISPSNAGDLNSSGTICLVSFLEGFSGNATISVFGQNSCGEGTQSIINTNVLPLVSYIAIPSGPTEVDPSVTPVSQYTTQSDNADEYEWALLPSNAGTLNSNQNQVDVTWSNLFEGVAYLTVTGSNECIELTSDPLAINVDIINNLINLKYDYLQIWPNPVSNYLNISCKKSIEELKIFNSSGDIISSEIVTQESQFEVVIDMRDFNSGVYYIEVNMGNKSIINKIVRL